MNDQSYKMPQQISKIRQMCNMKIEWCVDRDALLEINTNTSDSNYTYFVIDILSMIYDQ